MNENKDLTEKLAHMTADRHPQQEEIPQQQEDGAQNEHVEEQIAAIDENTNQDQIQATEQAPVIQQPHQQKESGHFKKLRESLERSEREKEQLYELLLQYKGQQQPTKQNEPEIDAHDFVPRTYVDQRLREAQEQNAKYQQVLYEQMVANQLKSQYSDFSNVLSSENISRLREEHPEIASSLAANPDIAAKAHATYKIIKQLGFAQEQPNYEPIKQKIQANSQKPRPATASPLSQASSYDYQRMNDDEMKRERDAMERAIQGG